MQDEAILAYQNAIYLNQYYSDCFYNLGNVFFEDRKDFDKAELCYKSALESLDEERSNQMYRRINDDQPVQKQSSKDFSKNENNQHLQLSPL